jgi:hypothetical protein
MLSRWPAPFEATWHEAAGHFQHDGLCQAIGGGERKRWGDLKEHAKRWRG